MCTNGNFFFLKYWKTISSLYCLATCMNPRVKVEGAENILNYVAICMNQPSEPEGKIYGLIKVMNLLHV